MPADPRRIFGREALDLARVLEVPVHVLGPNGGIPTPFPADSGHAAGLVIDGHGARVSLDIEGAAMRIGARTEALTMAILDRGQTMMALAALCAVQSVIRNYRGTP